MLSNHSVAVLCPACWHVLIFKAFRVWSECSSLFLPLLSPWRGLDPTALSICHLLSGILVYGAVLLLLLLFLSEPEWENQGSLSSGQSGLLASHVLRTTGQLCYCLPQMTKEVSGLLEAMLIPPKPLLLHVRRCPVYAEVPGYWLNLGTGLACTCCQLDGWCLHGLL